MRNLGGWIVLFLVPVTLGLTPGDYDPLAYTTGTFHGCPARGKGGDPGLNILKNRDLDPPQYQSYTVSEILALPGDLPSAFRTHRSSAELERVAGFEQQGVRVQGYIKNAVRKGKEDCNCKKPSLRDYHIWLVGDPADPPSKSVVVEITPRLLEKNPNWTGKALSRLKHEQTKVQITGWLLWDEKHGSDVGDSRGTVWEIHPILRIEVWRNGDWRPLAD